MINIESIVESVRSVITQNITDSLATVKLSYEKNVLANPIKKTYILLDLAKVTIFPYRDNYGYYTKQATYKLAVNIHRNESSDPKRLINFFSEVVNIIDECPFFNIEEAGCSEIKSDPDSNSIYLPGYIQFTILS